MDIPFGAFFAKNTERETCGTHTRAAVGLTKVEINNTDAEGRLVLGDGVAYAERHLDPAVIVDIATLTGAQGVATGRRHAAVLSNDEHLERLAVSCGRSTGDLVHPVVYCPEFFTEEFRCGMLPRLLWARAESGIRVLPTIRSDGQQNRLTWFI